MAVMMAGRLVAGGMGLVREHTDVTEHREECEREHEPSKHGTSASESLHRDRAYMAAPSRVNRSCASRRARSERGRAERGAGDALGERHERAGERAHVLHGGGGGELA